MTKLVFDEDRDLALSQPTMFVKLAAASTLIGALLGGTGALQLSPIIGRLREPPIWVMICIYAGIFLAPILAFTGAKLYRLAPWAPVTAVVLASLMTLLGLGQLAFMFEYRIIICLAVVGPGSLAAAALMSLLALRSAYASIGARKRLSDEGIELGV